MQFISFKMKLRRLLLGMFAVAGISVVALNTLAATDGDLGASSEGTSIISIIKEEAVMITKVDDLFMGTRGVLNNNQVNADAVCVFSSTGTYNLLITTANGEFELRSPDTTTDIAYSLDWITTYSTPVTYNSSINGLVGDGRSIDCNGTTNAIFQVTVTPAAFNSAQPGNYQDTLTLLVQPE